MQSSKAKGFRETMWFKRGHTESEQNEQPGAGDEESNVSIGSTAALEDRYVDDGSITTEDSMAFSVRTGSTQHLVTLPEVDTVGVATLMREMKQHGRRGIYAVGAGAVALALLVLVYVI